MKHYEKINEIYKYMCMYVGYSCVILLQGSDIHPFPSHLNPPLIAPSLSPLLSFTFLLLRAILSHYIQPLPHKTFIPPDLLLHHHFTPIEPFRGNHNRIIDGSAKRMSQMLSLIFLGLKMFV